MEMDVKLGVICTRREIFSKEDALHYKQMILDKLTEMKIDYVDIEDINEEGLLFDEQDVEAIVDKMQKAKIDALFFPHCNFGTVRSSRKSGTSFQSSYTYYGDQR